MDNTKALFQTQSGSALYLLCTLLSIFLFSYTLYIDDIINDDGMDYIFAAHDYMHGQLESARSFRSEQAFYAQIAFVAKHGGVSPSQAAYGLSLIAQVALMCGFLALIRVLGGNTTTQLLGILVFASLYHLNEFRPHILKGFAFWACQLWALWALIRYQQSARWVFMFTWMALGSISLVYRIEGVVYLAVMLVVIPLVARGQARRRFLLLAAAGLFILFVIGSIQLFISKNPDSPSVGAIEIFAPIARLKTELGRSNSIIDSLNKQKELIRETLPNKWARDSASHFLIGGLLFQVIKVILFTSNLWLLLFALGIGKPRLIPRTSSHKLVATYFLLGVGVCLYSVASRFFVTDRYAFFPALLLCLPIPFLLAPLFVDRESFSRRRHQVLRALVFIIPTLTILMPAIKDDDAKRYIPTAGHWIEEHINPKAGVYYNDRKIAFYAGAYENKSFRLNRMEANSLRELGYDYAIIHHDGKGSDQQLRLIEELSTQATIIHSVQGEKNKRVDIFKLSEDI